jgi:hypothetical protein
MIYNNLRFGSVDNFNYPNNVAVKHTFIGWVHSEIAARSPDN